VVRPLPERNLRDAGGFGDEKKKDSMLQQKADHAGRAFWETKCASQPQAIRPRMDGLVAWSVEHRAWAMASRVNPLVPSSSGAVCLLPVVLSTTNGVVCCATGWQRQVVCLAGGRGLATFRCLSRRPGRSSMAGRGRAWHPWMVTVCILCMAHPQPNCPSILSRPTSAAVAIPASPRAVARLRVSIVEFE